MTLQERKQRFAEHLANYKEARLRFRAIRQQLLGQYELMKDRLTADEKTQYRSAIDNIETVVPDVEIEPNVE